MNAIAQGARAPRFHRLKVAQVKRETPSAVSLSFAPPSELAGDFVFTPGQYLTLRATIGGEELRRSYSICSGPDEPELRVAVKEVEGGAFSSWVNRGLRAGDEIDVMTPTGRFGLTHGFQDGSVHVAFAAGSGVTPILSILRGVLAREPTSRFFLFYGSRTVEDVLFREALEELKDRYLGRLGVFHVLSREEQDISILNGHLDDAKVRQLLKTVVPAASVDHVFLCGPEAMIETISATLGQTGASAECAGRALDFGHRRRQAARCARRGRRGDPGRRDPRWHRSALRLQGRHVLHLPRQDRRRLGAHGRQLFARKARGRSRIRFDVPGQAHLSEGGGGLRPYVMRGLVDGTTLSSGVAGHRPFPWTGAAP
jgi:ferredoxin-NADP reductase